MKRAAVIDIGTNSVKLTVADLGEEITILQENSQITRLGKGVDSAGFLNDEAIQRTLETVERFVSDARSAGATKIVAAGTSALRDSKNGADFINAVKSSTGVSIEIISGDREANLAYTAIAGDRSVVFDSQTSVLMFDIGGGSTELIWGKDGVVQKHISLNIGAVRLAERHLHSDPPTDAEFAAATADAACAIATFATEIEPVSVVCGVGGTASTLAAIICSQKDVQGKTISLVDLQRCSYHLRSLKLEQRKQVPFLDPERADIIPAGCAILLSLLETITADGFTISLRGMRYGLLLEQNA